MQLLMVLLNFLFFISAQASVNIVGGKQTQNYPAVIYYEMAAKINSKGERDLAEKMIPCSGVVIADRAILTAAHCLADIMDSDQAVLQRTKKQLIPLWPNISKRNFLKSKHVAQVLIHPEYQKQSSLGQRMKYDLGLIIFDRHVKLSHKMTISLCQKKVNDPIELVGFGGNDIETLVREYRNTGVGVKRSGTNSIHQMSRDLLLFFGQFSKEPTATVASVSKADSGGAVINDQGELIGLISRYAVIPKNKELAMFMDPADIIYEERYYNYAVNLSGPIARNFLKRQFENKNLKGLRLSCGDLL